MIVNAINRVPVWRCSSPPLLVAGVDPVAEENKNDSLIPYGDCKNEDSKYEIAVASTRRGWRLERVRKSEESRSSLHEFMERVMRQRPRYVEAPQES